MGMSEFQLPRYTDLIIPTVTALKELGGSATIHELNAAVIRKLGLSERELSADDVRTQLELKLTWTRTILKNSDIVSNSNRGVWALRDPEIDPGSVDRERIWLHHRELYPSVTSRRQKAPAAQNEQADGMACEKSAPASVPAPDEDVTETRQDSDYELAVLQRLLALAPAGFERFCQRLLREAGFEQVDVTGRSHDGGIDGRGILRINPLVSIKVLFQCKRYSGSVGAREVRDFRGSVHGRADKGIIITTGSFTDEARKEAVRDGALAIDLVDRERLVEMLEHFELGLTGIETFQVDAALFREFER